MYDDLIAFFVYVHFCIKGPQKVVNWKGPQGLSLKFCFDLPVTKINYKCK